MNMHLKQIVAFALRRAVATLGSIVLGTLVLGTGLMAVALVQAAPHDAEMAAQFDAVSVSPCQPDAVRIHEEIRP